MRAVVIDGAGLVRVESRADPQLPGPDGAVVAVRATAICGSDVHFYDGDMPVFNGLAAGHEAVGTVVEAGPRVSRTAVGDQVMVSCVTGCGHCDGCRAGDPATCDSGPQLFGIGTGLGGAQAGMLAVPHADTSMVTIPDGIDDDAALLLTDNLPTAWTAARRAGIAPGATVVVLGLGAVGLCVVRSAVVLGAGRVLAYDPVAGRRERAESFGAQPIHESVVPEVLELTGTRGADVVIDAVATDRSLDDAFGCVRAGGAVSVVGIHNLQPYPLQMTMGVFRSITLCMSTAAVQWAWRELLPLIRRERLSTSGIITHHYTLEQAPTAYAKVAARGPDCIKVAMSTAAGPDESR